jgi:hypothetical protein
VTLAPKGLLIEEQRTNLLLQSETFGTSPWAKPASTTVTADAAVSPSGTITADLWARTSTGANYVTQTATKATSALAFTGSVYVKKSIGSYVAFRIQGVYPSRVDVVFNLDTASISTAATVSGSFTSPSASIVSVGNGFYRITLSATTDAVGTVDEILSFNSNGVVVDGTDSASNSAGYLWGAQLEAGAFATSYIPTVASQVTRAADSASMIGNNFARWFNQSAGTVYEDFSTQAGYGYSLVGTQSQVLYQANPTQVYFEAYGTPGAAIVLSGIPSGTNRKIAAAYALNNYAACSNGGGVGVDTSAGLINPTEFRVGKGYGEFGWANGTIKRITYYPRRLANSELQSITA